jgi:hypothetical protein
MKQLLVTGTALITLPPNLPLLCPTLLGLTESPVFHPDGRRAGQIVDDELNALLVRPLMPGVTLHACIDAWWVLGCLLTGSLSSATVWL